MNKFDLTPMLSRLSHTHNPSDVLAYGKKRRDFHMMGHRITVKRMGTSGVTTGALQACFYVCNETEKRVVCGPLKRLSYADLIINHLMRHMTLDVAEISRV